MGVTDSDLNNTFRRFGGKYGGSKEDYFAPLFIVNEFNADFYRIVNDVAFSGNDYGLDAFHLDPDKRNLFLYQFKWSENHGLFKDSLIRLIEKGMDQIFGNPLQDPKKNQMIIQLKSTLKENQTIIDRIFIYFVFNGDPQAAEQSAVLDSLREDLESKRYLIDRYFDNRPVDLVIQFISNETKKRAQLHKTVSHEYSINCEEMIRSSTDEGEELCVTFLPLFKLHTMYSEMGQRFFERNIRAGLSDERPANREIKRSLENIVIKGTADPDVFKFNHNGITLYAENVRFEDGNAVISEPRVLNGAQTITTFDRFIDLHKNDETLKKNEKRLRSIKVLTKLISKCSSEFVVNVTICNNRQTEVEPWNLRANDQIQLEFQDKFHKELGVFYERQENAFLNLSDEDLEEMGIDQEKAIKIKILAQTLAGCQGEIDRMNHVHELFESQNQYDFTFKGSYLKSDARKILLAYKIQYRLQRLLREIVECGASKYYFLTKSGRNLVWALSIQALLNHEDLEWFSKNYGASLSMETQFTENLCEIARSRVRFAISDAIDHNQRYQEMIDQQKYSFLKTKAMYQSCMEAARKRFKWDQRSF